MRQLPKLGAALILAVLTNLTVAGATTANAADDPPPICAICDPGIPDIADTPVMQRPLPKRDPDTNEMIDGPAQSDVIENNNGDRGCNFIRGCRNEDDFDPSGYKLFYAEQMELVEIPGKGAENDVKLNLDSANYYGMLADGQFEEYKTLIDATLSFVGIAVFGLYIIAVLAEPALALGETFRTNVAEPAQLSLLVLSIAAIAMLGATLKARYTHAVGIALATSGILAAGAFIDPSDATRYIVSTAVAGATLVLLGAAGENVANIPGPSTAPINTTQLLDAYSRFRSGIEEHMIGIPAQVLTFGTVLPDNCQAAYKATRELGYAAGDHRNFDPMWKENCGPYVQNALQPDAERWFLSLLLAVYAVAFVIVYALICWPALKGQATLIIGIAGLPFLILAAALPGGLRNTATRVLMNLVLGTLALIALSVQLAIILMTMNAILVAGESMAIFWRLVLALAVPVAFIAINRILRKRSKNIARNVANKVSKPEVSTRSDPRGFAPVAMRRATHKAQSAVIAAAGGAAMAVVHGAQRATTATKDGIYGNDKHAGLIYGQHNAPKPRNKDTGPTDTYSDYDGPKVNRASFKDGLSDSYTARVTKAAYGKAIDKLRAEERAEQAARATRPPQGAKSTTGTQNANNNVATATTPAAATETKK